MKKLEIFEPDYTPRQLEQAPLIRALHGDVLRSVGELIRNITTGELRYREASSAPVRDTQGHIIGAVAIVRDVTERKRAEEERDRLLIEVQRQTAELDATISGMADGLIIYNPQGEIMRMNDTAREMLGFKEEECRESVLHRWAHRRVRTPDGQPLPLGQLPVYRALQGARVQGVVMVVDGPSLSQPVWISASAGPIRTADGRVIGVVANYANVTPLIALRREVERRVAELDATLNAIGDGLVIYDIHGTVIRTNAAADRLLHFTPEERTLSIMERTVVLRAEKPDGTPFLPEESPVARALRGETVAGVITIFIARTARSGRRSVAPRFAMRRVTSLAQYWS